MSRKLHSKLLSVILCIAIFCATLCGVLIAAHAAAADYNGTYTISVGDDKQAVPFAATEVKVQVKFDLPAGFVGGQFTAKAQSTYTIGDEICAVAATKKDGTALTAKELETVEIATKANGSDKDIRFVIGDGVLCSSITIEYTIKLNDGTYVSNGTTTKYVVAIEVDGANFGVEGDYADVTFTASADSDGWFHSHSSWYGTNGVVLDAENNGKHTVVTNARCHWCTTSVANGGLALDMSDNCIAQVLPDYTEFDGVTTPLFPSDDTDGDAHTSWIGISGVTVSYNDDGSLDVDVHAYSQYRTGNNDKVVILVCDTEGNELYRLPAVANGTSYFAGNGFPTAEKMFTITGLSARDIDTQLLLTAVEYSTGTIEHSRTMPFCLADYCQNVVEGNGAIWVDGATSEQIEADKDVAAALYYYGASIEENVFDKNTSAGGTSSNIEYVNKSVASWKDTTNYNNNPFASWDAFIASGVTGNGEEATPYIISTAEQLHYITTTATEADTKGLYFKVADNVAVFDFMSSSVANKNDISTYKFSKEGGAFAGTFDGNGAIVRNLYKKGNFPGLFTKLGAGATVKNISVDSCAFVATGGQYAKGAGAIFGGVNGNWNGDSIYIENCKVTNCHMEAKEQTALSATFGAGVIGGYAHALYVNINNCFVSGNTVISHTNGSCGGLVATNYRAGSKISNSIVLGTSPFSSWSAGISLEGCNYQNINNATYSNVYTDQAITNCYTDQANTTLRTFTDAELKVVSSDDISGKGVVNTLNLDNTVWFDTAQYPELSIFHKLAKTPVDENTHKEICIIKSGSATCSFKGLTEEHSFEKNAEGTLLICECGYSKEIIGNTVTPNNKITVAWGTGYNANRPTTLADSGMTGSGEVDDPYIIKTPAQLYYVTQRAGADSAGKYYKVSDEIAVFDLSPDASGWNLADNSCYFQGNFDGNGVEIINLKGTGWHSALFPNVTGTVTIKNLKIRDAVIEPSGANAAAIIANINGDATTNVTVSQCVVVDTVVSAKGQAGAIAATAGNGPHLTITNCMVYNTTVTTTSTQSYDPGNCVLGLSWASANCSISDSIILGLNPENRIGNISNVYTDYTSVTNGNITKITDLNTLKGSGVVENLGLDSDVWFNTTGYPDLVLFHDMINVYVDENTHKSVCQIFVDGTQCTTCGTAEEHTLIKNADGTANVCSCGYEQKINGNTITPNNKSKVVWSGSMPKTLDAAAFTKGSGTQGDPYIITDPSQVWYIAQVANADTVGKYYKVDDSIGVFDFASINWGLSDNSARFQGNFDGNGVEFINFNSTGYNASLFPNVTGTVSIKNVKLVGATLGESAGNVGGIIANINGDATTNVSISQCAVIDTTITAKTTAGAIVATGGNGPTLTISDCIVYNTTVTTSSAETWNINDCVLGLSWTSGNCSISDSIILGCNPENRFGNISNVDTDYTSVTNGNITKITDLNTLMGSGVVENLDLDSDIWFDTDSYPELHVFHDMTTIYINENTHQYVCQVFVNGTQCTTCRAAVSHTMVDAEDGQSASCECGYSYEIKGIHAMDLPESIVSRITSNSVYAEKFATNALFKSAYNEDVYGTQVQENVFDMYATSLNLKVNPHIAFTFAFHSDYKTNRANITVTFTVDGETYTTDAVETNGVLGTNWVNNKGAGRYHLYRFKQLPVSKLCKDVQVTVNYNGATYDFGTYSAAGYAINAMNAGEDFQEHVNASMALVYYSEMLAARADA